MLTRNINSALIGLVLGDGSMTQPNVLYVRHGGRQLEYVDEKVNFLRNFIKPISLRSSVDKLGYKYRYAYYRDQRLTYFYKIIYKNNRKVITKELLRYFDKISLAFFFMDDGCLSLRKYKNKEGEWNGNYKSKEIYLCTHSFTIDEVRMFMKMLQDKFGLEFRMTLDKKYPRLWCNTKNTMKMVKIVKPIVSRFRTMAYKLA